MESKNQKQVKKTVTQYIREFFHNDTWILNQMKWENYDWQQLIQQQKFQNLETILITFRFKKGINCCNMLYDLNKLQFLNLIEITLTDNRIQNIECLAGMSMPCLQTLRLSDNFIVKIDTLSKANFTNVKKITLMKNRIQTANFQKWLVPNLENLVVQFDKATINGVVKGKIMIQDLSKVIKLKYIKPQINIRLKWVNRIKQEKVKKMFFYKKSD